MTKSAVVVEGEVYSVHIETTVDVVGNVAILVIKRGRGRPSTEKPPKEKKTAGRPRQIREPVEKKPRGRPNVRADDHNLDRPKYKPKY